MDYSFNSETITPEEANRLIAVLNTAKKTYARRQHESKLEEMRQALIAQGFSEADIAALMRNKSKSSAAKDGDKRSIVSPKYRSPTGETWSGRGGTPQWLQREIAEGRAKEDFLIAD